MSATPRTDEMELKGQPAIGGKAFIHSDFARTLERENKALREALVSIADYQRHDADDAFYMMKLAKEALKAKPPQSQQRWGVDTPKNFNR
jgi:hypothetical protein